MDPDEDRIYRWTIRTLYAVALLLNAWILWDQVRDTPEAEQLQLRIEALKARALSPFHDRSVFRKQANEVIYEAITVVEGKTDDHD